MIIKSTKRKKIIVATSLLIAGWLLGAIGYSTSIGALGGICLLLGLGGMGFSVVLFIQSFQTQDMRGYLIKIINKSLGGKRKIVDVKIITVVGYSENFLEQIEEAASSNSLSTFLPDIKNESDNPDNLIICDVVFKDEGRHIALIFDPYELYAPTRLLKLVPRAD